METAQMFLKNYTSDVPVYQTIARIEQVLLQCGVTGIMKEYEGTKVAALTFRLPSGDDKPLHIRLPADEDAATEALFTNYCGTVKRVSKRKEDFSEQGARTAWRVMKDWVEVQMSLIQLKQVDPLEVFLSYVWDGQRTYYGYLKEKKFAGLLQNK
jgi:hypothetical protein